jgi:hypothetical protein
LGFSDLRELSVSLPDIKKAIERANADFPGDWQAEEVEIAMVPVVRKAIVEANGPNRPFHLRRASNKRFGKGYVIEGWNSVRDDYYSHSPGTAKDGLRREFYGVRAVEDLRMWAHGFSHPNASALKLKPVRGQTVGVLEA